MQQLCRHCRIMKTETTNGEKKNCPTCIAQTGERASGRPKEREKERAHRKCVATQQRQGFECYSEVHTEHWVRPTADTQCIQHSTKATQSQHKKWRKKNKVQNKTKHTKIPKEKMKKERKKATTATATMTTTTIATTQGDGYSSGKANETKKTKRENEANGIQQHQANKQTRNDPTNDLLRK